MKGLRYILFLLVLMLSIGMRGQYNPTNPAEPGSAIQEDVHFYTLTLEATPANGGSLNQNAVTVQQEGTKISLRAYTNTNCKFIGWEQDGTIISKSTSFSYTMPGKDVKLIAHFNYDPSSPAEPTEPHLPVYSNLYLTCSPAEGGTVNIASGNRYEVGSKVTLRAYSNTNYSFVNWTENGEVISTSSSFSYTMKDKNPNVVANFKYTFVYNPANPGEPSEAPVMPKYYTLNLNSNPADGGYFNIPSGNKYAEGASVNVCAYNNQWYTFQNWTNENGEVVSTANNFNYVMPSANSTLTANYTYYYTPSNPGEPNEADVQSNNVYAVTMNALRGQIITLPFYMENTTSFTGIKVDAKFPEGFSFSASDLKLASRALGHSVDVQDLGGNEYRISIQGDTYIADNNGLLFDITFKVPDDAVMGKLYDIALSHGVGCHADGSQTHVSARSGHVYVEKVAEDGLYAKFSFDKLLDHVQFRNLSSDKAKSYLWDFGDGTTSTETDPLHFYANTGDYTVTLTAHGEYDEDVAEISVLINERKNWKVGGTFYVGTGTEGLRNFNTLDELFAFISDATVSENMAIVFESGKNYSLTLSKDNLDVLRKMGKDMSEGQRILLISKNGEGTNPVISIGNEQDELQEDYVNIFNSFANVANSNDVTIELCGLVYNPWKASTLKNQTVASGDYTEEWNFKTIGAELNYSWALTSETDAEAVMGFLTSGTDVLPEMEIVNIDSRKWDFVYHVTVTMSEQKQTASIPAGTVLYEFDKTITVTPGNATIDDAEWEVVQSVCQQLVDAGWETPWDLSVGKNNAGKLEGITVERGHITAIDLSGNNLSGNMPTAVLRLPRLTSFDLSNNSFSGEAFKDMLKEITMLLNEQPKFKSRLATLNISNNNFEGNVGMISSVSTVFEKLVTLNADGNKLTDVKPALPETIDTLSLKGQNIDKSVEIDLDNYDLQKLSKDLPSLITYNHKAQSSNSASTIRLSNYPPTATEADYTVDKPYWGMNVKSTDGKLSLTSVGNNVYRGANGSKLYVSLPSASTEVKNSYCNTNINFVMGNADFVSGVDATDVQATILYAFGRYNTYPFNFTAADTYTDGNINVQDVICTVNILLADDTEAQEAKARRGQAAEHADACIFIDGDNNVVLRSVCPVAALSVKSRGEIKWQLSDAGLTQSTANGNMVAFSLAGNTIPAGETVIGTCLGNASLVSASLSDNEAQHITVTVGADGATAIGKLDSDDSEAMIYSVSGVRNNDIQRGVNIIKRKNQSVKVLK